MELLIKHSVILIVTFLCVCGKPIDDITNNIINKIKQTHEILSHTVRSGQAPYFHTDVVDTPMVQETLVQHTVPVVQNYIQHTGHYFDPYYPGVAFQSLVQTPVVQPGIVQDVLHHPFIVRQVHHHHRTFVHHHIRTRKLRN